MSQRYRPLAGEQPEALALIAVSSETEEERTFTFRQLHDRSERGGVDAALAGRAAWRSVLVYMPMIAEAHITLLACARIGAIHSVVFGGLPRTAWRRELMMLNRC
ncbi:AMP-binding protein [Escherichia coli]